MALADNVLQRIQQYQQQNNQQPLQTRGPNPAVVAQGGDMLDAMMTPENLPAVEEGTEPMPEDQSIREFIMQQLSGLGQFKS